MYCGFEQPKLDEAKLDYTDTEEIWPQFLTGVIVFQHAPRPTF